MSLKKKIKHATACAISASVLLSNGIAHADPTPQVPQRSTPSPQVPQLPQSTGTQSSSNTCTRTGAKRTPRS